MVGIKPVNLNSKLMGGFPACCGKETVVEMIAHKQLDFLELCASGTPHYRPEQPSAIVSWFNHTVLGGPGPGSWCGITATAELLSGCFSLQL